MPSVSEPAAVEEVAAVLRDAAAAGRSIAIDRADGDVRLSTARLDRVLEHEAGDLTCTVEAGIRLSALRERLASEGQMLALDPPGDPTVGACLAGDLSGPRRHRYGTVRDLVLGVTVVLSDGTIAHSGGKVVKNVAGYDLGKLFCGSRGTLGLVARVSLRLHPRPRSSRTLVVPVPSAAAAGRVAEALHRSTFVPSAVDCLWPGRLVLLFEGGPRAVAVQMDAASRLVGGEEDVDGAVWEEIGERQLASGGRAGFDPGKLAAVLAGLDEAVVRVTAGVAYVPSVAAQPREAALARLNERVRRQFDPQGVLV